MILLEEVTDIHAPIERVFDLSLSVEVHVLGNVHFGEQAVPLESSAAGVLKLGDQVTWRARHFGVRQRLTSAITEYDRPFGFQDTMLRGAFAWMQHDHFFLELPNGVARMRDRFRFEAPLGPLGWIAERAVLARYMRLLLQERNNVLQQVAESDDWRKYLR